MKILVRGRDKQLDEFKKKFGEGPEFHFQNEPVNIPDPDQFEAVFDYFVDESPEILEDYSPFKDVIVFCNSVKTSLAELSFYLNHEFSFTMVGFNGLTSFIDRELLEVTLLNKNDEAIITKIFSRLGTEYIIVEDRVGMVTPRVICMIINEAYYTVQEGTADPEGIDLAMKLGANYPYGPFEWKEIIGIQGVYELLEALYEDTGDERYKICPALKREYILSVPK